MTLFETNCVYSEKVMETKRKMTARTSCYGRFGITRGELNTGVIESDMKIDDLKTMIQ